MKQTFLLLGLGLGWLNALAVPVALAATKAGEPPALQVSVQGQGRAMLLIPGYDCSGEVWAETVQHYAAQYRCHTVTLAGFAGAPPFAQGPYLIQYRDQLIAYLRAQVHEPAVIVGHSLGGFLALSVATTAPELVARVVVVDGLPFLPAIHDPAAKPKLDESSVRRYEAMLRQASPEQVRAQKEAVLATMVSDPAHRTQLAATAVRSDVATEAWVMAEMLGTDLRGALAQLQCPLLVLGAFQGGPVAGGEMERRYGSQFAAAPACELHMVEAKHFLMYEQQGWLWGQMDAFLKGEHGAR